MKVHRYPSTRFPFADVLEQVWSHAPLAHLHDAYYWDPVTPETDDQTPVHKLYRAATETQGRPPLQEQYERFLYQIIYPLFRARGETWLMVQKHPAVRVSLPFNQSVGALHCDADYHHAPQEINFWVPVTSARDSNSCWAESEPGRGDFAPFNLDPGEFMEAQLSTCRYYTPINTTWSTRVSFDFRVVPGSQWEAAQTHYSHHQGESKFHKVSFGVEGQYFVRRELPQPPCLVELRLATAPPTESSQFRKREQRLVQYVSGLRQFFQQVDWGWADVLVTDNTCETLPAGLTQELPEWVQVRCAVNNRYGAHNKGAGDVEQWRYNRDVIAGYRWFCHHEPRTQLKSPDFFRVIQTAVAGDGTEERALITWGSDQKNHVYTGTFAVRSDLLLQFIDRVDLDLMVSQHVSIEYSWYHFLREQLPESWSPRPHGDAGVRWDDHAAGMWRNA